MTDRTVLLVPHIPIATASPPESYEPNTALLEQRNGNGKVTCEPFGDCQRCPETEVSRDLAHVRLIRLVLTTPRWTSRSVSHSATVDSSTAMPLILQERCQPGVHADALSPKKRRTFLSLW
jgi:hypothetical protein